MTLYKPPAPLSEGARKLFHTILEHVEADRPVPAQAELAATLGVEKRTVERWVRQLRQARLVRTQERQPGMTVLAGSICPLCGLPADRNESAAADRNESAAADRNESARIGSHVRPMRHDAPSADRVLHGGGGGHDSLEIDPPTPPARRRKISPTDITTKTGIWMVVECRFSHIVAYELQHLDLEDCKADYAARRAAGQGNGAIVQAWRVAPPPSVSAAPWAALPTPDELPGSIARAGDAGPAAGAPDLAGDDDASWQLPATAGGRWAALIAAQLGNGGNQ